MIHLPQEICDDIIDKVADDGLIAPSAAPLRQSRDTLRSCALVCTLWTARAQKVLFRALQIRFVLHNKSLTRPFGLDTSFFVDPFRFPFYKGLRKHTHLLSYVKDLKIKFIPGSRADKRPLSLSFTRRIRYWKNERRLRYVLDVINSLRAVEQLEVDAGHLAPYLFMPLLSRDVHSALLSVLHLPSVTTFRFSDGVLADLLALLRECPQITRLVVGWIYGLEGPDVATLVPPKLDSLVELVCNDKDFLRHLETIFPSQQMINYGSLRCLHFGQACVTSQGPDEDSRWMAGVLRRLDGKLLQHLSLCIYPIEPLWRLFDLSNLVYLELTTHWYDESWAWWIDWLIQSFSIPSASIKIQQLTLSFIQFGAADVDWQPQVLQWNVFDKALASWPELQRVILKTWRPENMIDAFPEMKKNGKLKYEPLLDS
ncbi:hypothetical protein BDZ89DRAFT_1127525 [Hymenopellis radicata]|nr:hypothetical protein BDZ89DRAFT_1127525 [Hymenopellis radicata]